MKTTKTYVSGCTWCGAYGSVTNPDFGKLITSPAMIPCPVCQGAKIIMITETIEDDKIKMPNNND